MEQKKLTERIAYVTRRFYLLNEKARKSDPSALKEDIDAAGKRDVFEYGLLLCVNGVESSRLNEILSNLVKNEKNEQEKRFKSIQKEAVTLIQKGSHSRLFLCSLFSYLNIEEIKEALNYLSDSAAFEDLKSLLEKPVYNDKIISDDADNSLESITRPFSSFYSFDVNVLLEHLKNEKPLVSAYVISLLDSKKASFILSNLEDDLQSGIAYHIAVMDVPDIELIRDVLKLEKKILSISGKGYADIDNKEFKKLLKTYLLRENAINESLDLYGKASNVTAGSREAVDLTNRLMSVMSGKILDFFTTDTIVFFRSLLEEHPKTITCILSMIEPSNAALMLQCFPDRLKCDVASRIALMDKSEVITQDMREQVGEFSPLEIREIEKKLSVMLNKDCVLEGGIKKITELLCLVDKQAEKTIMEFLENVYHEVYKTICDNLFVFDDIVMLDDKAIQKVLQKVDTSNLAMALKNSNGQAKERIYNNMTKRAAYMLKEEEGCLTSVSMADCEAAQKNIVSVIRHLEEMGEIVLANFGDEYV